MKWLKDGLSMDETKISALIIAFYITLGFALFQAVNFGDISDNMLMLLAYELGAFTGIKVAESFITKKTPVITYEETTSEDTTTKLP